MTTTDTQEKTDPPTYYCWVRLVPVKQDVRKAEVTYYHGTFPKEVRHGSRPPGVVDGDAFSVSTAGPTMIWSAAPEVFGREGADTVFEYGPAYRSRCEALNWLSEPAGIAWDKEALNRFLMTATPVPDLIQPDLEPLCTGGFPETDWAEEFKSKHSCMPTTALFKPAELILTPPTENQAEEAELLRLANFRGSQQDVIYAEAQGSVSAALPVLRAAGLATDVRPVTPRMLAIKRLRQLVLDSVEPTVYDFKRRVNFCRPRPWTTYPGVQPWFRDHDHKCYPGHPAFPSGHATVAYVFAYLIAALDTAQDHSGLEEVARQVAQRREIAGVHFPSDSAGGKHLARQMVDKMLVPASNPDWQNFACAVRRVFPSATHIVPYRPCDEPCE
jgi:PAP2 superfamily